MNVAFYALLCLLYVLALSKAQQEKTIPFHHYYSLTNSIENDHQTNISIKINQRQLTHVVVPFHYSIKQLSRLERQADLWTRFPPCLEKGKLGSSITNVTLVWYLFTNPNKAQFAKLHQIYLKHYRKFESCFQGFQIVSAGLGDAEDNPDMSSRRMFEKLLDNSIKLHMPDYVLNIEPDVFPIKSNWLQLVQTMLNPPTRNYWVIGSTYLGNSPFFKETKWACVLYHINGNAIYDIGSGNLKRFYFQRIRPFMQRMMPGPSPYDVDMKRFLMAEANSGVTRLVRSRFLYSDFIANWWRREISWNDIHLLLPHTIFIHSGQLVE